MSKKYYAGHNSYGTNFVMDTDSAWSVLMFSNKSERDNWVNDDSYARGNPTREVISRDDARRLTGSWTESVSLCHERASFSSDDNYPTIKELILSIDSYNPHFWG